MGEAFRLGGFGMFPTLIFGLLTVAAATRYAMKPERRFVPLQISLGIVTLAAGALGTVTGITKSFMAIDRVPADKQWIWMLGMGESLHVIALALGLVTLGAIASSIGSLRFARSAAAN